MQAKQEPGQEGPGTSSLLADFVAFQIACYLCTYRLQIVVRPELYELYTVHCALLGLLRQFQLQACSQCYQYHAGRIATASCGMSSRLKGTSCSAGQQGLWLPTSTCNRHQQAVNVCFSVNNSSALLTCHTSLADFRAVVYVFRVIHIRLIDRAFFVNFTAKDETKPMQPKFVINLARAPTPA